MLTDPSFEELVEWNHQWNTVRVLVFPEKICLASGYGWTHHCMIQELKAKATPAQLNWKGQLRGASPLACIVYHTHGRVKFCIDDESECSDTARREILRENPNCATVLKDLAELRLSL